MIFVLSCLTKNGREIMKWQIFKSWKHKWQHECFQIKYPGKVEILVSNLLHKEILRARCSHWSTLKWRWDQVNIYRNIKQPSHCKERCQRLVDIQKVVKSFKFHMNFSISKGVTENYQWLYLGEENHQVIAQRHPESPQ